MPVPRSDRNSVDLVGEIAGIPRVRRFDSGATLMTFALRIRATPADRPAADRPAADNVPIAQWDPGPQHTQMQEGQRVRVRGRVRRRFYASATGPRSTVEVLASSVEM
jgi:single-strand DNA-binding protein